MGAKRIVILRHGDRPRDLGDENLSTRGDGRAAALAEGLRGAGWPVRRADNVCVTLEAPVGASAIDELKRVPVTTLRTPVTDRAVEGLKFSNCLPEALARKGRKELTLRLTDVAGIEQTLRQPVRVAVPG